MADNRSRQSGPEASGTTTRSKRTPAPGPSGARTASPAPAGSEPWVPPAPRGHVPTMQDIAAASGVSQSTVSRVLTAAPTPVPISPATRERVLEVARQMHYRPNPLARGLRGARTMLLGVIVREITDPFFAGAVDAISTEASRLGYNVVLGHAHGNTTEAIALRAVLETRHCDAILLLGDTSDQPLLLNDLRETDVNVVGVWQGSAALAGMTTVNVDNRAGIYELIDHLTGLGHRRIAFIGGRFAGGRPLGDIWERRVAFSDRLAELGVNVPESYIREAQNNLGGGASAFEALMELVRRPTAVVASTDVLALGAVHAACRLGLAVPADVSIAGFDDLPMAEYSNPPLTTVRQPIAEMAAVAVGAATEETREKAETVVQTLEPQLIIRGSTGPALASTD
jgi:DNA-binding LacI/PurR family transcriptional regulator